jgi:hypothetical protein
MENLFVLEIPANQLKHSTDMLRYDSCYEVRASKDRELFHLFCASFTPARWASFNASPRIIRTDRVSAKERGEKLMAASGFVWGLRFAQQFMSEQSRPVNSLVEGTITDINIS